MDAVLRPRGTIGRRRRYEVKEDLYHDELRYYDGLGLAYLRYHLLEGLQEDLLELSCFQILKQGDACI